MSPPLWLAFLIGCGSTDKQAGELGDTGVGSASTVSPPSATPGTSPTGSTSTGTTTTSTPTGSTPTGTLDHTGDTSSARDTAGPLDTARADTADTGPPPPPPCHPLVIAHRGASGTAPEDTLAALELAFAFGTRLAEVDVRVSSDGRAYLLHDPDVDRTTRALGPGSDLTLLELRMLDAGRWKGEAWVGQTIPSLADALRLADRFGASLYIDPKTPAAEAVAAAIDEAGVSPETVWLSFGDPFQLEEYAALLPTSPGVWWGGIPEDWGEPDFDAEAWFESLSLANVVAVEFDWPTVLGDERFASYSEAARDVGLEIWTYTVNNRDDMVRAAGELGLDGIETDYPIAMQDILCGGGDGGPLPEGGLRGTWSFTDGLLPEGDGSQLVAVGGLATELGEPSTLGLPELPDGGATQVLRLPAPTAEQAIRLFPNAIHFDIGNGLGINQWSLLVDILRPPESADGWIPLLQTNHLNENDAEVYLRPGDGAIGILEQYHGELPVNEWHRVAITVDTTTGPGGTMSVFIDGAAVGEIALTGGIDSRFSLNSTWAWSEALLFADPGGFTSAVAVSSLQLHDRLLSPEEIAELGAASASGLPER